MVVVLVAVDAGGVLDDDAEKVGLVDVLHLLDILDAAVGCGLLQVVLLALAAPEAEDDVGVSLADLGADGCVRRDGSAAVDGGAAAHCSNYESCYGSD